MVLRQPSSMLRREWMVQTVLATGFVSSYSHALALAERIDASLDTEPVELQDKPKEESPKSEDKPRSVTTEMVRAAAWMSRVELTDAHCEEIAGKLSLKAASIFALRKTSIEENTPMAMAFVPSYFTPSQPQFGKKETIPERISPWEKSVLQRVSLPEMSKIEQAAFWTIEQQALGLRSKRFTSEELTRMYLDRLKRFDPELL